MQQKRILLFTVLVALLFGGWLALQRWLAPPKPEEETKLEDGALHLALGQLPMKTVREALRKQAEEAAKPVDFGFWDFKAMRRWALAKEPLPKESTRVTLGDANPNSPYHLQVELDSRGAGVRRVVLNKFRAADEQSGKPLPNLLELVPDRNPDAKTEPAANNLLFHFAGKDAREDVPQARPVATLGEIDWKPSSTTAESVEENGRQGQSIRFTTEIDGVEITKIFTLFPYEYHIGLEVRIRRLVNEERWFRYQLTGSLGVPIEGRWFTSIFRNALIGTVDPKGYVSRDLQTSREIGVWEGGNVLQRDPERFIRYAGISNQYFASVVVVAKDQKNEKYISNARPTLERALVKGKITSVVGDKVVIDRDKGLIESYYLPDSPLLAGEARAALGHTVALLVHTDPKYQLDDKGEPKSLISQIDAEPDRFHAVWEDDITVRLDTEPIDLTNDEPVVHKYLLYNGPVKPRLLGYMAPEKGGVSMQQVDFYEDLGLNTMIDFHSPGVMGRFASMIYWTDLLIMSTNVMHWVLNKIHWLIPSYGLSIICLTILVRAMMLPVSLKGARTSVRMQELAPEMKKLQEKYKDDPQGRQMAQMELFRKHGVNPLGTCWFMVLQMPIFMGLYFALQESIAFRLASFWPTWIDNLAAPDMLFEWGSSIPILSTPQSYGGSMSFLYLGPYLNVLPIIAVALMIVQQKMMTPPPTDEQQEMQQKMMKYMMVFMGLMFYKVAAGLCIYFIASSVWGFAERKLLPKKKPAAADGTVTPPTSANLLTRVLGNSAASDSTAVTTDAPASKGKGRRRGKDRAAIQREEPTDGGNPLQRMRRWFHRKRTGLSEWWAEVLKQAAKKER